MEQRPEHFAWQTQSPYVADRERELVQAAFLPLGRRVLDVGCGHGATLRHLGAPSGAVGVDVAPERVAFAARAVPECRFLVADGAQLPFAAGSFDQVLIRDVLHHVADPGPLLAECDRVLDRGGRLDVLEPCRYNPLIFMHGLLDAHERLELRSTRSYLHRLISARFDVVRVTTHQAFPFHRVLFHPRVGARSVANRALVRWWLGAVEATADRLLPSWMHAYLHLRAHCRR